MVAEGLVAAGYNYIQIDDCWAAPTRDKNVENGAIVADPIRFPSGMAALAQYLHSKGMKLGLYGDIGATTCGGYLGFNVTTDGTNDAQLQADVDAMAAWGIDSLKVDGCSPFAAFGFFVPYI